MKITKQDEAAARVSGVIIKIIFIIILMIIVFN